MNENKKSFAKNFKLFILILGFNLKQGFKQKIIYIFGLLYTLSYLVFPILCISENDDNNQYIQMMDKVFMLMLYCFNLFFLFLLCLFVVRFYFQIQLKKGILKLEQREGVPIYNSFMSRIMCSIIFLCIYIIVNITICTIVISTSTGFSYFHNFGFVSYMQYTPLVALFLIGLLTLIVCILEVGLSIFLSMLLSIFYILSRVISSFIVDNSDSSYSKKTQNAYNLALSLKIGKMFYDEASDLNIDIYDPEYGKGLINSGIISNNNIAELYSSSKISNLLKKGDYDKTIFYSGTHKSKIFSDIIEPLNEFSKSLIKVGPGNFLNVKNLDNMFFNNYNDKKFKSFVNEIINSVYKLPKNNTMTEEKWIKLLSFCENHMIDIWDSEVKTKVLNGYTIVGSYIPLWEDSETIFPYSYVMTYGTTGELDNVNWELRTLLWEIMTFYNSSLSPVLNNSIYSNDAKNNISIYDFIDSYNKSKLNLLDQFLVFNHIYDCLLYTDEKNKEFEFVSNVKKAGMDGKLIYKPFSLDVNNPSLIKDKLKFSYEPNESILVRGEPYIKFVSYTLKTETSMIGLRFSVGIFAIVFIALDYIVYYKKIKR